MPLKLSVHPRDFARQVAAGKSVADMTAGQKLISQAKNYARMTARDFRGMSRAKRMAQAIDPIGGPKATLGGQVFKHGKNIERQLKKRAMHDVLRTRPNQQTVAKARKWLNTLATREKQWQGHGAKFRQQTAMRVGAAALGTAGAIYGVKAYRKHRDKAREKTRYRKYDVVKTAHGHTAVGQQVYNQPYYNEVGAPRVYEHKR